MTEVALKKPCELIPFPSTNRADSNQSDSYNSLSAEKPPVFSAQDLLFNKKERSKKGIIIIRTIYSERIIESLNRLANSIESTPANSPDSLRYSQSLLINLIEYRDKYFEDPFASYLSALYDALINNDTWISLSKNKYMKIREAIKSLNNISDLGYEKVDKAINDLEIIGFDTTPY